MPSLASVPSPAQESSEDITAQLPGISTSDDLHIALQKKMYLYSASFVQFYFLFSFISFFSFVHFIFGLAFNSQEYFKCTVYFKLESGDAGGDDSLRAE